MIIIWWRFTLEKIWSSTANIWYVCGSILYGKHNYREKFFNESWELSLIIDMSHLVLLIYSSVMHTKVTKRRNLRHEKQNYQNSLFAECSNGDFELLNQLAWKQMKRIEKIVIFLQER